MSVSRKKGGSSIHFMNPFIVEVDGGGIKQVPAVPNFSSEGSAFLMESVNLDRISESPKAFLVCVRFASGLFFALRLKLNSLHRAVFQYVYDAFGIRISLSPSPFCFYAAAGTAYTVSEDPARRRDRAWQRAHSDRRRLSDF